MKKSKMSSDRIEPLFNPKKEKKETQLGIEPNS